jgi:hypothetical protein
MNSLKQKNLCSCDLCICVSVCKLKKSQPKDGQKGTKPAYKANSASYAAAAAASVSPHFAALMATIGAFVEDKE